MPFGDVLKYASLLYTCWYLFSLGAGLKMKILTMDLWPLAENFTARSFSVHLHFDLVSLCKWVI